MEMKLCRICGQSGHDFIHIFKTEGLKNKIETCLPIIVSPHCLLPETLCPECLKTIENFYVFLKNCLQNIIILESQLDIQQSCLKTKRKKDKGCYVTLPLSNEDKSVQTEDYLNVLLGNNLDFKDCEQVFPLTSNFLNRELKQYETHNILVDYEVLSDSNSDELETNSNTGQVTFGEKIKSLNNFNNIVDNILYRGFPKDFQSSFNRIEASELSFIHEISERKNLKKRRNESIETVSTKICKFDSGNKRKCSKPKKVEKSYEQSREDTDKGDKAIEIKNEVDTDEFEEHGEGDLEINNEGNVIEEQALDEAPTSLIQETCLLCNLQIDGCSGLAEHFVRVHAKEFPQQNMEINSSTEVTAAEKKKRNLPSLVKISDLRRTDSIDDGLVSDHHSPEESTSFSLKISCPNCPTAFTTKPELFVHLQLKHSEISTHLCGICLKQVNSISNLKNHVLSCSKNQPVSRRYYCGVCYFGEDNYRSLESHVLVHGFLLETCRKEVKNFDPEDYIKKNPNFEVNSASPVKNFSCLECSRSDFDSFRRFSIHRRNVHSIYHCDLCNKFYGRNSHLWKHVHRLHKGHPSITCQICFKTSASKYHLAQHFTKIHQLKTTVKKEENNIEEDQNGAQKFSEINFRNCKKPILKKQDSTTDQEHQNSSCDDNSLNPFSQSENDNSMDVRVEPKEIDASHDLYTNILTNYTPPKNEGDFKCPKCSKGFHKRMLLRKHKKNCRPKLQKDLLTRCKSCARIFKDRQSLAKHLINYHSDYLCEICSEKVPSKCEIVTHIRFQHPSSHLVCSVCENILRCKKDLLEHLADHENSYVCQFCGDSLSSKVKLKMHILSLHRKILSLSCGICLKLFENQLVLRNHVTLVHKDRLDPLTSCPVCGKNYGSKWKTFDHVNKSHGRIFKACKICLEIYETESQLESHMKTSHITHQISGNSCVKPNPVAILTAPVRNESVPNLNNNTNDFESDSEDNTEETENNTQSSDSEEDENSRPDQLEDQKSPPSKNFLALTSQENRISLLEKRLLGKTATQSNTSNEKSTGGNSQKQYSVDSGGTLPLKGEYNKDNSGLLKVKKEDDNFACDKKSDHMIHHTKRTVYVNSNDPSFCEICHKTWPAKKHLWQHYIRCHKKIAATVCGICLKTNKNYESLQMHLRETHPTLLHGQGFGSNFICRICGRYHNASSKLSLHMVIHENFDWTLLDRFPPILKYQPNVKNVSKLHELKRCGNGKVVNGNGVKYEPEKVKKDLDGFNDDEMYGDMIEQVEESSTSSETEATNKPPDSSTDSEGNNVTNSSQTKEPQSTENTLSFSNLLQSLKNHNQYDMLTQIRKESLLSAAKPSDNAVKTSKNIPDKVLSSASRVFDKIHQSEHRYASAVSPSTKISNNTPQGKVSTQNSEYIEHSYLSEESSSSMSDCVQDGDQNSQDGTRNSQSSVAEEEVSRESQESIDSVEEDVALQEEGISRNLLRPKPEELDSAIKSISDPCTEPMVEVNYNDFSESIQPQNCLNDTEIENAVGSIL